MSVTITWLGHSAFKLEAEGHEILLDPFLTGNPLAATKPEDLKPEIIFLSHGQLGERGSSERRNCIGSKPTQYRTN